MPGRRKWPEEGATAKRVRNGALAFTVAMIILAYMLNDLWVLLPAVLGLIGAGVFCGAAATYAKQRPIEPNDRSRY
jgi:uncharacterized membrane protein YccC